MTRIEAIAGHVSTGVLRSYVARREDGLTTDAIQLGVVALRHFKLATAHYKLSDADQADLMRCLPAAFEKIQRLLDEARKGD